jgi:dTDP-L-rhamnose 4-epimerase
MSGRVLITGGAGFIGSHLADELLEQGYQVRSLDNLSEQVHGPGGRRPDYLSPEVELVQGDVRDPQAVRAALAGVDSVFHFAAMVGVGQSMYEIERYTSVNNLGTAVLLEALIERPVGRLVVASSMSIYGEGSYQDADGNLAAGCDRDRERLKARDWEVRDAAGRPLSPVPTAESKPPTLSSVYALSKYDQERLAEVLGREDLEPEVTGKYRVGDIRHCFADITLARSVLGYEPRMPLAQGLIELASWLQGQVAHDRVAEAGRELAVRGLTV